MRVVVALGGNALAKRGEPMNADALRANVRIASALIVDELAGHELVLTHGNGPQVGLLALQNLAYRAVAPYPLDVLGAQTQGMIGYVIQQELEVALAGSAPVVTVITTVEVDPQDPAFARPTKFIGPQYPVGAEDELMARYGWTFARDGEFARRVVASPAPMRIRQTRTIQLLLEHGHVVVCVGGGGVPVEVGATGGQRGVEAVIDKDLSSAVLAQQIGADAFIMLTDGSAACQAYGTPEERAIRLASPEGLSRIAFAEGSMKPKIDAAVLFARSGGSSFIGALDELPEILARRAGTEVRLDVAAGVDYYASEAAVC